MKLRHVRAIAVFGIAVVALTGARGSHGASCGGGHGSSSSHSSSSGGSSSGTTGGTTGTTTSGGGSDSSSGTSSGTPSVTGGSSSANKAERDIKIDKCRLDDSGKNLVARLTVTNSGSLSYTYNITMKFEGAPGSNAVAATARVTNLTVKAGGTQQAEATTPYTGKGNGSEYKECVVSGATKTAS